MAQSRGYWLPFLAILVTGFQEAAACPQTCYGSFDPPEVCLTDAANDRCVINSLGGGGCLEWNLPEARWRVRAPTGNGFGGSIHGLVQDDYTIEGPASAVPIEVDIRLHLQGEVSPFGCIGPIGDVQLEIQFAEETSSPVAYKGYWGCTDPEEQVDTILTLHASRLVGQPFRVKSTVHAGATYVSIELTGTVAFDVPQGYRVVSCQGFESEPLSIDASTWTRTKALYR